MIRTFLFDMGNVLVHFCHERMCRQMADVCGTTGPEMRRLLFDGGILAGFERGRMTEGDLHRMLEQECRRTLNLEELIRAGSDIFSINEPMVPLLDELKAGGYRLVLLSNTCLSHLNWIQQKWDVLGRFDELVTSHEVGAAKPEPPIFEAALAAAECEPQECFYTDDIAEYITAAREYGMDAEVYADTPTLRGYLRRRGVNIGADVSTT